MPSFDFSIYQIFEKKILEGNNKSGSVTLSDIIKSILRQYVKEKEEVFFHENQPRFYENQVYFYCIIFYIASKKTKREYITAFLQSNQEIQKAFEAHFTKNMQFIGMLLFFAKFSRFSNLKEIVVSQRLNFLEGQKINFPEFSVDEAKEGVFFTTTQ